MPDSSAYETYRNRSLEFFVSNQFQDAVDYFAAEAEKAEGLGHLHSMAYCWLTKIRYQAILANYEEALKELEQLKQDAICGVMLEKDRFLKQYRYYIKATIYYYQGKHRKALKDAREIDFHFEQKDTLGDFDLTAWVLTYLLKGRCEWRVRNYTNALSYYIQAIQCLVREKADVKFSFLLAKAYNLIAALLIELREESMALDYLKLAESIYESPGGGLNDQHPYLANLYGDICNCLLRRKREDGSYHLELAGEYLARAASIYECVYGDKAHRDNATVKKLEAFQIKRAHQQRFTEDFLQRQDENIEIRKIIFGSRPHFSIANAYNQQARYCLEYGEIERGLSFAQLAIQYSVTDFKESDDRRNPSLEAPVNSQTQLILALYLKAELRLQCFRKRRNKECLEEALKHLEGAVQFKRKYVQRIKDPEDRLLLVAHARPIHEAAMELLHLVLEKGAYTLESEFINRLYNIVLGGKAYLLLEDMRHFNYPNNAHAKENGGAGFKPVLLSKRLLAFFKVAYKEGVSENQRLDAKAAILQELAVSTSNSEDGPIAVWSELPETKENISIKAIQKGFDDKDAAAISFFVGKRAVYGVLLSREEFLVSKLISDKGAILELKRKTDKLHQLIAKDIAEYIRRPAYPADNPIQPYADLANDLYQQLLAPMLGEGAAFSRLYFIPDDFLWKLPFETLLSKKVTGATAYQELPYLLVDYSIAYHFSIQLLFERHRKKKEERKGIVVTELLALNAMKDFFLQEVKDRLKYEIMELSAWRTNPKDFWQEIKRRKPAIVLLDAHLKYDEAMDTSLIPLDETREWGRLEDIAVLEGIIDCDLFILKTCKGGGGEAKEAEGSIGFSRLLYKRGARNILYSQFSIEQGFHDELIKNFLQVLNENMDQHVSFVFTALRRRMLMSEEYASPDKWGKMIYLGDATMSMRFGPKRD